MINPHRLYLRCRQGHSHLYELEAPGMVDCQTASCPETLIRVEFFGALILILFGPVMNFRMNRSIFKPLTLFR